MYVCICRTELIMLGLQAQNVYELYPGLQVKPGDEDKVGSYEYIYLYLYLTY